MKKQNDGEDMIIYGTVKVSDKGQIAIPVELRNDLGIKRGDQLLIVRRKSSKNFTVMTMEEMITLLKDRVIDDFIKM